MALRIRFPKTKMARREAIEGYLFILPWILGFLVFRLGPMIYSLFLSFTDYAARGAPKLIGLENYIYMFTQDPRFLDSLRSTLAFVVGYLPLNLAHWAGDRFADEPTCARHPGLSLDLLPARGDQRRGRGDPLAVRLPQTVGHLERASWRFSACSPSVGWLIPTG